MRLLRTRNRCSWAALVVWQVILWHVAAVALAAESEQKTSRPNILFIMSDDHAYHAVSAYGSQLIETPNIDRIADAGIRFDRCYVTNSICGPSRSCILTGKYSHKNGYYDHSSVFDGSQQTFPKLLQQAGYQTAVIGKWHLTSDPTGFDHWDILPDQGKYYRPDFITKDGRASFDGYTTEIVTQKSLDWLREGRNSKKPFLLMMHHKAPHRPWDPSPEKLAEYADKKFPEPATLFDDYATRGRAASEAEMRISQMNPNTDVKLWDRKDKDRRWLYRHMSPTERAAWEQYVDPRQTAFDEAHPEGDDRTRWFYQLYMRDYLGCIASVDESVGEMLDYLDESELADNTLVVYVSDQGFYLGEHGWFDKRFMYEQSLRTPLMIRWPGVTTEGKVEDRIVSNLDFAETLLDVAGVSVPADMQGRSFAPLLRGESPDEWRNSFYYHYYEGAEKEHHVPKHEGVTTGRAKLINFYPLGEWQLFDLQADPQELNNLWGQAEHAELQAALVAELAQQRAKLELPPLPNSPN